MQTDNITDIALIGGGIMSATLGVLLKELQPDLKVHVYERLDAVAQESSDAWNNAGTGHSALCELNYTPQMPDGTVDISKALHITEMFEESKQFWSYLVAKGALADPHSFINSIPHISFAWGADNVHYLRTRYETMRQHHFYETMQYAEDFETMERWMPIVMAGRDKAQPCAASRMEIGTDVNFGALSRQLFSHLEHRAGFNLHCNHEVEDISRDDTHWHLVVKNKVSHEKLGVRAQFVFIGAGGGALSLLEKAHIPEAKGYGGFPVSGQWLVCQNPDIIRQHHAKVYGKASVGTPPMSVPHLDTRVIDGKQQLLFGPYAGFSTRFLKKGSLMDLPRSIRRDNILPMLATGAHNLPLVKYLVGQLMLSENGRLKELKEYLPKADGADWTLQTAGQRVQVIKKDEKEGGILEFGTEVVSAADGSLAALLGASPGASTSVHIMLDVLRTCFKEQMRDEAWQRKLSDIFPSYGHSLAGDPALCKDVRAHSAKVLKLVN
jgi:malate dehydrogenase (quinone)